MRGQLVTHIEEVLSKTSYGLVEIEDSHDEEDSYLRMFIEHKNSSAAVTIDDCVIATHAFDDDEVIDAYFEHPYHLEVSSPGPKRPLRKQRDFDDQVGNPICLVLKDKEEKIHGILSAADNAVITLENDGAHLQFERKDVLTVNLDL